MSIACYLIKSLQEEKVVNSQLPMTSKQVHISLHPMVTAKENSKQSCHSSAKAWSWPPVLCSEQSLLQTSAGK